jgi:hypothetical protein
MAEHEMGLLSWVRRSRDDADRNEQACSAAALERVVKLTNPRLRFARRYVARLTPSVQKAREHARLLVASIPPAHDGTAAAWHSDGYMRAFFATARDSAGAFSRSPDIRTWFGVNGAAQEVYAVLSTQLMERRTFGVALESGIMRRDVPQTTVSFGDYRARICGATEADVRTQLARRIVDQLALAGLALAAEDRSRRDVLDQERALLRARLRLLERQGAGMAGLASKVTVENDELARLQVDIAMNEANLASISAGPEGLDNQLERLREVLGNPGEHFSVSNRILRLDRQNVVLAEDSAAPGETLDLQIARVPLPEGPSELRAFVLVRFPRAELLPRGELFRQAARTLN